MKNIYFYLILLSALSAQAQFQDGVQMDFFSRQDNVTATDIPYDPNLKPFYHGVASGDPLTDRVIIWTRITPDNPGNEVSYSYKVCTDTSLLNIVKQNTGSTNQDRDYTVKLDISGLLPNTVYYYQFTSLGKSSIIGRTKTAPENTDHVKFAVVSCSNYEAGYFNAYNAISKLNDLDAVIHLGDYIYEYQPKQYGDTSLPRYSMPDKEIVEINDYRTRYSFYRLDKDLIKIHQQQPFIVIWDDHESANDSYKEGAQNHTPGIEGDWNIRKNIAKKVYFEWMPIRDEANYKIYRSLQFGKLAKLILLDTRLEERTKQAVSMTDADFISPSRTMLGNDQLKWFTNELSNNEYKWKIVGNQVIFSELNIGFAADTATSANSRLRIENQFLDIWDGYPTERLKIMDTLQKKSIQNTVFVTGDFHSSFGFEVARPKLNTSTAVPAFAYLPIIPNGYDTATAVGSVAVEFVGPSVTSANFDEYLPKARAEAFEYIINKPIEAAGGLNFNPHMKYVDLDRNGYFLLNIKSDSTQADWYYVNEIKRKTDSVYFDKGLIVKDGTHKLKLKSTPAAIKSVQAVQAPKANFSNVTSVINKSEIAIMNVFPMPAKNFVNIQYGVTDKSLIQISLTDLKGIKIKEFASHPHSSGMYQLSVPLDDVQKGVYLLKIQNDKFSTAKRIVIDK